MPGSFGPARESAILFAMRLLTFLYHGLEHAGVLTGEGIASAIERYELLTHPPRVVCRADEGVIPVEITVDLPYVTAVVWS